MRRTNHLAATAGPRSDERGGVVVEYTVILVLVSLVVAGLAVAALGPSLVRTRLAQETWLLLGLP
jgi:Flp pilus assembly pilin Flp